MSAQHGQPAATTGVPGLRFSVRGAAAAHALAPTIALELEVERIDGGAVRSLMLAVQVRIAAPRRRHDSPTRARLRGVFGAPEQWATGSLTSLLWARPTVTVPGFERAAVVELLLPCSYDTQVAHDGYLCGVRDGTIPLELLFSGTVFFTVGGRLQAAQVPWESEAEYALPAAVWQQTMDRHFPDGRWLRLDAERLDRLAEFRARRALPSWEATVDALLQEARR
ncbi:MAG TPA: DUF6084 family protein [Conexibacter sp.]|jgi:hypothetical protein